MPTAQEIAQKSFDEQDRRWTGPKFIGVGFVTLVICLTTIYLMSTTSGCSLQIVPCRAARTEPLARASEASLLGSAGSLQCVDARGQAALASLGDALGDLLLSLVVETGEQSAEQSSRLDPHEDCATLQTRRTSESGHACPSAVCAQLAACAESQACRPGSALMQATASENTFGSKYVRYAAHRCASAADPHAACEGRRMVQSGTAVGLASTQLSGAPGGSGLPDGGEGRSGSGGAGASSEARWTGGAGRRRIIGGGGMLSGSAAGCAKRGGGGAGSA